MLLSFVVNQIGAIKNIFDLRASCKTSWYNWSKIASKSSEIGPSLQF